MIPKKFDWSVVLSVLSVVLNVVAIVVFLMPQKEKFSDTQDTFAQNLFEFFTVSKPDYIMYLGFLNENKNMSMNLVVKKNYESLIQKSKEQILTKQDILNIM